MVNKLLNSDQLVFPFLRDDLVYEASLLRSRIAREVERGLTTKLTDRLSEIIVTTCYKLIDETVERAINRYYSRSRFIGRFEVKDRGLVVISLV